MEELDDWLTPMQAVAWIALRDPVCVRRASLDVEGSRAAAAQLGDRDILDDEQPGLTLHTIDLRIHHPRERLGCSAEVARDQLIRSLRGAKVIASGEPMSSDQPGAASRRLMTNMDWIGLTLEADQQDARTLVVHRPMEGRILFYGRYVDTQWHHVLINTEGLLSCFEPPERHEPDRAPEGYLFIDTAVEVIKKRLSMPEGPAVKWLREKLQCADIQSYYRRWSRLLKVPFSAWSDADIDLMEFREAGNSGLFIDGQNSHLHRVVLAVPDLEFCITATVREPAQPELAVRARAAPRRQSRIDYRAADAPLVQQGVQGVRAGSYRHATDAAQALCHLAEGAGTEASKKTRLAERIVRALEQDSERSA